MGSVMEYIECPRCKSEQCVVDFHYKTGNEFVGCPDCGYSYSIVNEWADDANGDFRIVDTKISESKEPYGCAIINYSNGGGMFSTIESEDDYHACVALRTQEIKAGMYDGISEFKISRFVDGVIKVETIYTVGEHKSQIVDN
jgi:hypothetical protein